MVHSLTSSRLDYCNSLLFGMGAERIKRPQYIKNAAARLVSGTRKFDRITPVLRNLHWLPVAKRIAYKVVMLVHKCLNGRAPSYLADVCIPVDTLPGRRQLCYAATGQLLVPRTSTNISRRGFHCCGPATWNALPVSLRTDNKQIFWRLWQSTEETPVQHLMKTAVSCAAASINVAHQNVLIIIITNGQCTNFISFDVAL